VYCYSNEYTQSRFVYCWYVYVIVRQGRLVLSLSWACLELRYLTLYLYIYISIYLYIYISIYLYIYISIYLYIYKSSWDTWPYIYISIYLYIYISIYLYIYISIYLYIYKSIYKYINISAGPPWAETPNPLGTAWRAHRDSTWQARGPDWSGSFFDFLGPNKWDGGGGANEVDIYVCT